MSPAGAEDNAEAAGPLHELAEFNPFGPGIEELYDVLRQARERTAVFYSKSIDAWCVTRYADVMRVAADHKTFSSRNAILRPSALPEVAQRAVDFKYDHTSLGLGDPPRHTLVRRIVHEGFKPKAIAAFEPAIRELIAGHVAGLPADRPFDLVADFASVVPLAVILQTIGLPSSDITRVRQWNESQLALLVGHGHLDAAQLTQHGERYLEGISYFRDIVEERRRSPGDDLVSYLARGGQLTTEEAIAQTYSLIAAGWETTANAMANAVRALLDGGDLWRGLARGTVDPAPVVLEALRFDTPVIGMFRSALRDVTIGGVRVPEGARVFIMLASANYDPDEFPAPDAFHLGRSNPMRHLSFGHGIHNCVGAPLARLELGISLKLLAERFPDLTLSSPEKITYKRIMQFKGPKELWVVP